MPDVARAFLALHEPGPKGLSMGALIRKIDFSFNPKEVTLQRTADWKAEASKKPKPPEYNGAKGGTVSLEMFLDKSEGGSVISDVADLLSAVVPSKNSDTKEKPTAPYVSFGWGVTTYVESAIVKSVSAKYTRFDSAGVAIRAIVTVSLEEIMLKPGKQNPTSGASGAWAVHVLRQGDSLASIAHAELGAPTRWRAVATANGIDDPFRLRPGRSITIPSTPTL